MADRERADWVDRLIGEVDRVCAEEDIKHARFAITAGMPVTTLHSYKSGKSLPNVEQLVLICNRCKITPNSVLGFQCDDAGLHNKLREILQESA